MKEFFNNPKWKNPYFWLSVVSLIFASANIEFNTLTSWQLFGEALLSILNNPVSVMAVLGCLIGIFNDNSTHGLDSIKPVKKESEGEDGQ